MGKAAEHLSTAELENIAESLFTVKSRKGGELIGLCPVHDDKIPSFSYNPVKDVCHCFSCGFGGDIITLWSKVKGHGAGKEGFKAFCREYNITDSFYSSDVKKKEKSKETPPLDDAYHLLGELPESWVEKLQKTRGWNPAAMDWLGIRQQTHYQAKDTGEIKKLRKPERIAIPVFDDDGHVRNIRLYKPGAKKNKIISWGKAYGSSRLFPPSPRENGTVLLCEGESDTVCAISNGFNAITQTTKPKKWTKDHLKKFEDRDVVIAFDADQPGQMYAKEYAGFEIYKVAKTVKLLEWPDIMGKREDGLWPEDHGQDLTDFFQKHKKTAADLQRLMDDAKRFEPPEDEIDPQALEFFERGVNDRLSFKPRLLAEKIREKFTLLYCPDTGLLHKWNNEYWEEFHEDHLRAVALRMLGKESKQAWVQDAVFQVKSLSTIPHGRSLNDKLEWVCIKNGMLNIETLVLKPHDPKYYASYQLNVSFNPESNDRCERWIQFLKETVQTPAVIDQVQEFFGYCFLKKTPFAKCLLLLGDGSDGKSKFIKVLIEMIGAKNCAAVNFNEMEDQFLRSTLYQKAVNVCGEVGGKIIESTYFKAVSSGDRIHAAFKHKNTFEFEPYCKLIFSGNKMPRVKDTSDGLYRRLLPIQFKRQFMEGDPDTDPFLEEKLLSELSEIFLWSLAGLKRLLKNRQFTSCEETTNLMMDYKRLNNPVLCFAQDTCTLDEAGQASKKDLFKGYEKYCRENGYRAYSRENFFRELYAAFATLRTFRPRKNNPHRIPFVKGIRIVIGDLA
ncbi:phage/plasmid primase, P4 family [Desulfobacula phenolica]|uniref:Putative DNA primase/helicase n=1 Tax=Desulfobacula phenolica TaxID=90732 RepID=A0A1H2I3L3_9BACT|nr:phage/plasmid primase, P4 family [Desulfobacula phenolica]SDU38733.1 putative DNA primase/helicase [Desulfobacula phenolica]